MAKLISTASSDWLALGGATAASAGGHFILVAQQFEPHLQRIAAGGVRELVDEAVNDP
jgi:hypothetical protein